MTSTSTAADSITVPRLRAPIVLVHGLLGFSPLRVLGRTVVSYFPGIEELFQAGGNRVYCAGLSPTGGVATRAEELRTFLRREVPAEPVHLIAHSMGGLDARYLIARLGMEDHVLSLTTLGTPHRGSPFADWGIRRWSRTLKPLFRLFDIPHQAFFDLTTEHCQAFNAEVPDVPGVRYFSVAGRCHGPWLGLEWWFPHSIIARKEGDNDGLVSIASATYGEHTDIWEGDHLSLANWPNPRAKLRGFWRERSAQYAGIVKRLATAGF